MAVGQALARATALVTLLLGAGVAGDVRAQGDGNGPTVQGASHACRYDVDGDGTDELLVISYSGELHTLSPENPPSKQTLPNASPDWAFIADDPLVLPSGQLLVLTHVWTPPHYRSLELLVYEPQPLHHVRTVSLDQTTEYQTYRAQMASHPTGALITWHRFGASDGVHSATYSGTRLGRESWREPPAVPDGTTLILADLARVWTPGSPTVPPHHVAMCCWQTYPMRRLGTPVEVIDETTLQVVDTFHLPDVVHRVGSVITVVPRVRLLPQVGGNPRWPWLLLNLRGYNSNVVVGAMADAVGSWIYPWPGAQPWEMWRRDVFAPQGAVADFDQDGSDEAVALGAQWAVVGDPTIAAVGRQLLKPGRSAREDCWHAVAGDWNGDGWPDLAVLVYTEDPDSTRVAWYRMDPFVGLLVPW